MVMGAPYDYERVQRDAARFEQVTADGKFPVWWEAYLREEGFRTSWRPFVDLYQLVKFEGEKSTEPAIRSGCCSWSSLADPIDLRRAEPSESARPGEVDVVAKPTAAQIRKSITPDALISFIDGKPYRMLKRHLNTHGLTAKSYQERYGLPTNYPMTAPSYSAARSALATKMGLGRKAPAPAASTPVPRPRVKGPVSKSQPGERAGPGARVPKAVRSMRAADVTEGGSD